MVVKKTYIPECGDIVWISFSHTRGHEQRGIRPALVVSPAFYNASSSLAFMCPFTSNIKGYPFEVLCNVKGVSSAILVDQARAIDWRERGAKKYSKAPEEVQIQVKKVLAKLLVL